MEKWSENVKKVQDEGIKLTIMPDHKFLGQINYGEFFEISSSLCPPRLEALELIARYALIYLIPLEISEYNFLINGVSELLNSSDWSLSPNP